MSRRDQPANKYDVAIVGYGPTGATLALLLAQSGLSVVVLERESDIYFLPRAVHFDDETMRVFQTVGIGDALREKVRVNPGMQFVDDDGTLLLDWPRPQTIGPQGWHASFRLHQPDLEQLLREKCAQQSNAAVLTNCEVTGLEEAQDGVRLSYRDRRTAAGQSLQADYVVGCDGARSLVRQVIGSEMDDLGFRERWLVIDVLLKRARPDLGDHTVQFCNPERPMTYCRNPGARRRWEIRLNDGEADADMTSPARVWELLSRWITADDADLERAAVYTFHSDIAQIWRKRRILIAGDAAHLTPPFMGQGMCAGIRDAANLAWKLALQLRRLAHPTLLDSYQDERRAHVYNFVTTAVRLGGLINSLDRDAALALGSASESGAARMASLLPRLGDSEFGRLDPNRSPHRGLLFGQPVLRNGRRMDDLCGYTPILIARRRLTAHSAAGVSIINGDDEPAILPFLDELSIDAVLLRPDRYIMSTACGDDEISKLLEFEPLIPMHTASPALQRKT